MRIFSWHRYPLKSPPPLIWVSEFDFIRSMSLDECYAKLTNISQKLVEITEVSKTGRSIHFAATKSLKLGKLGVSADLKGKVYIDEANGLAHIDCLLGESVYPTAMGVLIFVSLVVLFNIFYFRSNILIVGIFALITLLEELEAADSPESVFSNVPGIGKELAGRIVDQLHIKTLPELEEAAHNGQLASVEGFGTKRLDGVKTALTGLLSRSAQSRQRERTAPDTKKISGQK